MNRMKELQDEIATRQAELAKLVEKEKRLTDEVPEAIADYLHEQFCRMNHTDGCGYHYEKWHDDKAYTKPKYLAQARVLLDFKHKHKIEGTTADFIDFMKSVSHP